MLKTDEIVGIVGTSVSAVGTAMQVDEVLKIISLVITIVGSILTLIVMPLINWYQKAKQDGKITVDEIKEGITIVSEGTTKVKDDIKDKGGD